MSKPTAKRICVFCSSSNVIDADYLNEARFLGEEMARRGHKLVYGGGDIGSMGMIAHAVQDNGGQVVGVIPHALNEMEGVGYSAADELIVTETMRQRKAVMEENADAFIALPGGLGTLEELLEIITMKQLHYHAKPIVILNTNCYFDPLIALLEHAVNARFMKRKTLDLFHVSDSVIDTIKYIESYVPEEAPVKWLVEEPEATDTTAALE
jgi:cytokinin riboside 5'-monophosphate phosphoribohydrolase